MSFIYDNYGIAFNAKNGMIFDARWFCHQPNYLKYMNEVNNNNILDSLLDLSKPLLCIELHDEGAYEQSNNLSINEYLFNSQIDTFLVKIFCNKYNKFHIKYSDLLIIKATQEITNGKYVLVQMGNQLSIKQYRNIDDIEYLKTENGVFLPVEIEPYIKYKIIGVISTAFHSM